MTDVFRHEHVVILSSFTWNFMRYFLDFDESGSWKSWCNSTCKRSDPVRSRIQSDYDLCIDYNSMIDLIVIRR